MEVIPILSVHLLLKYVVMNNNTRENKFAVELLIYI